MIEKKAKLQSFSRYLNNDLQISFWLRGINGSVLDSMHHSSSDVGLELKKKQRHYSNYPISRASQLSGDKDCTFFTACTPINTDHNLLSIAGVSRSCAT